MGRLDVIKAALDKADATAAEEATQVSLHFSSLAEQVADLQATIDELRAGEITDAEISELASRAEALSTTVEAIDTEGDAAPTPDEEDADEEPAPETPPEIFEDGTVA